MAVMPGSVIGGSVGVTQPGSVKKPGVNQTDRLTSGSGPWRYQKNNTAGRPPTKPLRRAGQSSSRRNRSRVRRSSW
jgi:hypothetical protein